MLWVNHTEAAGWPPSLEREFSAVVMTIAVYPIGAHKTSTKQPVAPGRPSGPACAPTFRGFGCSGDAPEGLEDATVSPTWGCHARLERAATRMSGTGSAEHVAVAHPTGPSSPSLPILRTGWKKRINHKGNDLRSPIPRMEGTISSTRLVFFQFSAGKC